MPKPTNSVARLVIATGGSVSSRTFDQRLGRAQLDQHPDGEDHEAGGDQPERPAAPPAPRRSPAPIAYSGSTSAGAEDHRAADVDRPGVRTGDSGITSSAATAAITAMPAPSQKSTW